MHSVTHLQPLILFEPTESGVVASASHTLFLSFDPLLGWTHVSVACVQLDVAAS